MRAHVRRVQVVGDEGDIDVKEADEVGDGLLEMGEGAGVGEIAEVLGEDDVTPPTGVADDGDGVL